MRDINIPPLALVLILLAFVLFLGFSNILPTNYSNLLFFIIPVALTTYIIRLSKKSELFRKNLTLGKSYRGSGLVGFYFFNPKVSFARKISVLLVAILIFLLLMAAQFLGNYLRIK